MPVFVEPVFVEPVLAPEAFPRLAFAAPVFAAPVFTTPVLLEPVLALAALVFVVPAGVAALFARSAISRLRRKSNYPSARLTSALTRLWSNDIECLVDVHLSSGPNGVFLYNASGSFNFSFEKCFFRLQIVVAGNLAV